MVDRERQILAKRLKKHRGIKYTEALRVINDATNCSVPGHPEGRLNLDDGTFYCGGCENTHDIDIDLSNLWNRDEETDD